MSRGARLLSAVAAFVAAMSGLVIAADIGSDAATVERQAIRVDPPRAAVVIGDSAIAALRWVPGAANAVVGFEHTLDLESYRRLWVTSCRGRERRRPPSLYEALPTHVATKNVLVVATGYNDSGSKFDESFVRVVARARTLGYRQIVWWTLRSEVDYVSPGARSNHTTFAANNDRLRALLASGDYPDVVIADWDAYSAGKHAWFATDGVHYRSLGAWAAADYLSRKMAFLEQRRCPQPTAPGEPTRSPCPDPDETGPPPDIAALYRVSADGVLCYEIGEQRRVECRADSHVLQIERELSIGMFGNDVRALQIRLDRFDLSTTVDGGFGPATQAAVIAFQQSNGLAATGVADRATLEALGFDTSAIR